MDLKLRVRRVIESRMGYWVALGDYPSSNEDLSAIFAINPVALSRPYLQDDRYLHFGPE